MLKNEIIQKLNEQVVKEFYSSNLYLALSAYCNEQGLDGSGAFFFEHSKEEADHARKIVQYLNDTDSKVVIGTIDAPKCAPKSVLEAFEIALEHERYVTQSINDIVDFALTNKDFLTFNFLQWFVSEQLEELVLFGDIVDKLKIIASDTNKLYLVDQYVKNLEVKRD
ncbi:MAG: ferritin [Helicobacter sp.]|nr:ferritin [Helicobacter sp.]